MMLGSQAAWDRQAAHVVAVSPLAASDWEAHRKLVQASLRDAGGPVAAPAAPSWPAVSVETSPLDLDTLW